MIRCLRISFDCRSKDSASLVFEVNQLADQLRYFGYALGKGLHVVRGEDPREVNLTAYFTGRDAWAVAQKDERDHLGFHMECVLKDTRGSPRVTELKVRSGEPIPSCDCGRKAKPALDLWCTPESDAPPLLCSEGGVVEFYKLPLSMESLERLDMWRKTCIPIAKLHLDDLGDGPYDRWAGSQLASKTSWIGREAAALAKLLTKELGRKVRAFRPPANVMRL
jgi:hypothetical protein